MCAIISEHPHKKLENLLLKFEKNLVFEDFVKALEYAIAKKIDNCSNLLKVWKQNKRRLALTTESLSCFSKILPTIWVEWKSSPYTFDPTKPAKPISEEWQKLKNDVIEEAKKKEPHEEKYAWFEPSLVIVDLLSKYYPDDIDPGIIIGKYLHVLSKNQLNNSQQHKFATNTDPDDIQIAYENECINIIDTFDLGIELSLDSPLHIAIHQVGKWAIGTENKKNEILLTALECILFPDRYDTLPFHNNIKPEEILFTLLIYAPNDFLNAWISQYWLNPFEDYYRSPSLTQESLTTTLLLLSFGKNNDLPALIEDTSFPDLYENKDISEQLQQGLLPTMVRALPAYEKRRFIDKNFSYSIFVALCTKWVNQSFEDVNEELNHLIPKILTNYTNDRRTYYNGLSILETFEENQIRMFLWATIIEYQNIDLTILLSQGQLDFGELFLFHEKNDNLFKRHNLLYEKQGNYLILFNKAIDEGLPEFGVALLSLFLFTLCLLTQGQLTNLSSLIPSIQTALQLPNARILEHTLKLIVEFIESLPEKKPAAQLVSYTLQSYLPSKAQKLKIIHSNKQNTPDQLALVEQRLQSEIGKQRWQKLSKESQGFLISSGAMWASNAIYFGAGIEDWSGYISGYCKTLEKEIVDRLENVFFSNIYLEYLNKFNARRPQKPSIGYLLNLLKKYESLPKELQDLIQKSKNTFYNKPSLINKLYNVFQTYRNVASHKDRFDMVHYAEFKKIYFTDGLLRDFIDNLH